MKKLTDRFGLLVTVKTRKGEKLVAEVPPAWTFDEAGEFFHKHGLRPVGILRPIKYVQRKAKKARKGK